MRILLKILDVSTALIVLIFILSVMGVNVLTGRRLRQLRRKLLVLDMAYTLEMVRERQLHEAVTCRDLNGYFEHVWSVHPCATVIPPSNPMDLYGPVEETPLAEKHTIAEGKIGRYNLLESFPLLNFLLSQWHVYCYLINLVRKEHICAVRAGDPYYLGLWAVLISRVCKIPCAVRVNVNYDAFYASTGNLAFPRLFRKRWVEKLIDRFTLKRMDLVAGANQDNLDFAIANGARKEYATVFRYGNLIHSAHFVPHEKRPSPQKILEPLGLWQKPFSFTISRLEPMKHPDDVLRVIAELKKRGYILNAIIAGEGSMGASLETMAKELDISGQIVFAGNRNQEWLATVIPHATVIMSPFMGRALTETALGGRPIVAYDIDWQGELIQSGITGELVPYKDWQAMTDAVEKYLRDPGYAKRMGENARALILEMMDPARLTEHERKSYESLLQRFFPKAMPAQ